MNNVELVGVYGSDELHALSAWTSTSRDLTPEKRERIPGLLKMLAENEHHTPFEKSALHFLVDCDTASHIHLLKHRIGVSINGESARYKELAAPRSHTPTDWPDHLVDWLDEHTAEGNALYHAAIAGLTPLVGRKRAKESARYFLGYNNVLTLDVMFNFRSFMHFQGLRNDEHAQLEVRRIAQTMLDLVRHTGVFTHSLTAFGY